MKLRAKDFRLQDRLLRHGRLVILAVCSCAWLQMGCDKLSSVGVTKTEARTAEDSLDAFLTYQDALVGKDADAVLEVFGKPKGVFEKRTGAVWMYSRWCVQFDSTGAVVKLERDVAARGSESQSLALASHQTPQAQPAAVAGNVVRITNGGQQVDLNSVRRPGKITVVDFYADWCGPCRRIAPELERLAKGNPDVVLVKVDIVDWHTPVVGQYNIQSIPNIRVFDRNGLPVGTPTSSLDRVRSYLKKAGG